MVVFTSELIHRGGAFPIGLAARNPGVIALIALANYNLQYNNIVPIHPPSPWVYAKAQVPTSTERCGRSGCRKVPVCQMYATGTCSSCDAILTAPMSELFEAPAPDSPLCSMDQVVIVLSPPHASYHWETLDL